MGCGEWFVAERDTTSNAVQAVFPDGKTAS
jgi:sarcosine oxidase delta subunit